MILKFDHLAYGCRRQDYIKTLKLYASYNKVFQNKELPNLEIKRPLLKEWSNTHDIVLLKKDGRIPVEITAYDKVVSGNKFSVCDGNIIVNTLSAQSSEAFFQAIGFKTDEKKLIIKPALDSEPITLMIQETSDAIQNYLDSSGYCCMAFVVSNAQKERKRLSDRVPYVTEVMKLLVNDQILDIFFAYDEYGDICECISVSKENEK